MGWGGKGGSQQQGTAPNQSWVTAAASSGLYGPFHGTEKFSYYVHAGTHKSTIRL